MTRSSPVLASLLLACAGAGAPPPDGPPGASAPATRPAASATPDGETATGVDALPRARLSAEQAELRRVWLRRLGATIEDAFDREDTEHPVFHCCIDWHSSVHAHWALLTLAEQLDEPRWRKMVLASIEQPGLDAERAALAARTDFENPYGRAWFLRLDLAARRAGSKRLAPMASELARSLRVTLERPPGLDPTVHEYGSRTWALRQLGDWYAATADEAGLRWAEALVRARLAAGVAPLAPAEDHARAEFFSRWGNWAHLLAAHLEPPELSTWLADQPSVGAPVAAPRTAHHLGMNFSRAWALFDLAARLDRPKLRDLAWRHVEAAMETHAKRSGDYWAYGHWVGQFGVYALGLGAAPLVPAPLR